LRTCIWVRRGAASVVVGGTAMPLSVRVTALFSSRAVGDGLRYEEEK
jgi:hypothetical protein